MIKELIIDAIKKYWPDEIIPGVRMFEFIRDVVPIYFALGTVGIKDSNGRVGLMALNSRHWVAAYIAALLRGSTLVIIPPYMNKVDTRWMLTMLDINVLLTDSETIERKTLGDKGTNVGTDLFLRYPMMVGVYDIQMCKWKRLSESVYNEALSGVEISDEDRELDFEEIDEFFDERMGNYIETVITPTSGAMSDVQKYVVSPGSSIGHLVKNSIDIMPYDCGDSVFSDISFAEFHYLNVLLPFLKGCRITFSPLDANVFIEDTVSMENKWRHFVDSMLENSLYNWLFTKTILRRCFGGIAVRRIKKYYKFGNILPTKKVKSIMVLNWYGQPRILNTLVGKLPMFTTYGCQECNQLIAYNNYETKAQRAPNCVGKFVRGYYWEIDKSIKELYVGSPAMFLLYYKEHGLTEQVTKTGMFRTDDAAEYNENGLLFVYGRVNRQNLDRTGNLVNLDNVERIIKNSPYVKDALLCYDREEEGFVLSVEPDDALCESRNLDYMSFAHLVREMANDVETYLPKKVIATQVRPTGFVKTYNGKKLYRYYPT